MDYKAVLEEVKKNELSPIYLFVGTENYLMEHTIQSIKGHLIPKGFEDLNYQVIDGGNTSFDEIINMCETMPFMAEKKLVVIKDFELLYSKKSSIGEDQEYSLISYIEDIPKTTHLFFLATEKIDKRKKFVKALVKHGKVVEFSKLQGRDLYKWIERAFVKKKKTIEAKEIALLVEIVGYSDRNSLKNLQDIENEIIKISNYVGDRSVITKDDIELLAPRTIENNIFSMVEALGVNDGGKALRYLNEMLMDGEPEIRILYMITRQFRLLFQVKLLENKGYTSGAIAPKLGIQPFIVKRLLRQSINFDIQTLRRAMEECLRIDIDIKKGKINQRFGIELLISKFIKKR